MSESDQKELANQFCQEIVEYLGYLKGNDSTKRDAITRRVNRLTIASAILPIIVTFISAYAYILTQQVITFCTSFVDVVPPILMTSTKGEMEYYNKCSDLQLTFTGLKGNINRLATIGQLKEPTLTDIKNEFERLKNTLRETIKVMPRPN